MRRVHRESVGGICDEGVAALLEEILSYPGVPLECAFNFFSTVTVIGTPQDVTLQELRIECFVPADTPTAEAARQLCASP